MKKESLFSSKKVNELKSKKRKKSVKIPEPKRNNDFFENQEIKQDLESFYDSEAKKYAETRKKFWHEEKAILDVITPLFGGESPFNKGGAEGNEAEGLIPPTPLNKGGNPKNRGTTLTEEEQNKKIRVLEFGCGSGRFATLLNQNFPDKFDYVGIDLSNELLSYASTANPNLTFFQGDITKLIKKFEQESFDLIVGTSSFQHIPTAKERSFLMKNFYRLLDYDGVLLMTNWSLSKWFIKKYRKAVFKARFMSLILFDKSKSRDIMVPRIDNKTGKVYERFYHFFSLNELQSLSDFAGLSTKFNVFVDQDANFTYNEKISRSSFLVATKTPIIN